MKSRGEVKKSFLPVSNIAQIMSLFAGYVLLSVAFLSHLQISFWDSRKDSKDYLLVDKLEKETQDYMENMPTA